MKDIDSVQLIKEQMGSDRIIFIPPPFDCLSDASYFIRVGVVLIC